MSDLGRDELQLLAAAREGMGPSAADRARLRATLSAAIAAGPVALDDAPPGAPGLPPETTAGWLTPLRGAARWLAGGLLLGSVFGGGFVAGRLSASPAERAVASFQAAPLPASAPLPVPKPSASVFAVPERLAVRHAPTLRDATPEPRPSAAPDALAAEVALLQEAQRALKRGDPERALVVLRDIDERVPRGALGEEREAARVLARCATEPGDAARALGRDFAQTYRSSVYVERVRAACGSPLFESKQTLEPGTDRTAPGD